MSYKVIKNQRVEKENSESYKIPIVTIDSFPKDQKIEPSSHDVFDIALKKLKKEAEEKAQEIIKNALEEKEKLLAQAQLEIEKIKKKAYETAYKEGYEVGKESGHEAGYKNGWTESENLRAKGQKVLENAHVQSRKYIEKTKKEIIQLAMQIAENITHYQIDKEDANIVKMIKKSLMEVKERKQIILRCHPENVLYVESNLYQLEKICSKASITLLEDEGIEKNGCVLESERQIMDLQISGQLENIKKALLEMRDPSGD